MVKLQRRHEKELRELERRGARRWEELLQRGAAQLAELQTPAAGSKLRPGKGSRKKRYGNRWRPALVNQVVAPGSRPVPSWLPQDPAM